MMTDRALERRTKAIRTLSQMSERLLQSSVIDQFFRRQGWITEDVHHRNEGGHRCDLLLTLPAHEGDILWGVQLKARIDLGDGGDVDEELLLHSAQALSYKHPRGSRELTLDRYYWITTGHINTSGWQGIKERISGNPLIANKVHVWDVDTLLSEIDGRGCGDLLDEFGLNRLEGLAKQHERAQEGVFAAHYWQRIGRWYLTHKNSDPTAARGAFDRSVALLDGSSHKNKYYFRVLIKYAKMWSQLTEHWQDVTAYPAGPLEEVARSPRVRAILTERNSLLLYDLERTFQQLDLLEELQLYRYAGLMMLQVTRLLLRAGYPPTLPGLENRLACIGQDLSRDEVNQSIDQECSLCTAMAVSCYSLAGRGSDTDLAVKWLKSLKDSRYCHRSSNAEPVDQHSLHYAATVLVAFLDHGEPKEDLSDVIGVFIRSDKEDSQGLYLEWMLYRAEGRFWVCRHIFAAFLHYLLSSESLGKSLETFLLSGLRAMTASLQAEASEVRAAESFYPLRESLGSLSLGLALEDAQLSDLASRVAGIVRMMGVELEGAGRGKKEQNSLRTRLWAANIERSQIFVEGVLQYWEAVLSLEES